MLPCKIHGLDLNCLIDTGATISLLHPDKYHAIPEGMRPQLEPYSPKIRMGDGAFIKALGCAVFPISVNRKLLHQKMVVANIEAAGVLGYDFLYNNSVDINIRKGSLIINGTVFKCELESQIPSAFRIGTVETVTIPPNSEMIIQGRIHGELREGIDQLQALVEPWGDCLNEKGVIVAKTLVNINGRSVPLRLANLSQLPQTIYTNTIAAKCEPVEIVEEKDFMRSHANYCRTGTLNDEQSELPEHLKDLYQVSETNLSNEERGTLRDLLKKHQEASSKFKGDIGKTSLVEHRIFVGDNAPI